MKLNIEIILILAFLMIASFITIFHPSTSLELGVWWALVIGYYFGNNKGK